MGGSLADTDHVLGHELVHAFQYDITGSDARKASRRRPASPPFRCGSSRAWPNIPSIGPVDPQTAMWLRDAAMREKLPTIRQLDDPKYFPYRWGQAFWAYIGGRYGDAWSPRWCARRPIRDSTSSGSRASSAPIRIR